MEFKWDVIFATLLSLFAKYLSDQAKLKISGFRLMNVS